MRRQYHSRDTKEGTLTWDVHRLVECSRGLPVHDVPLTAIRELNETYWFPPAGPAPTCKAVALHAKLIEEADLAYPILLCADGRLMDGMHRVCKAFAEGHTSIQAIRFKVTPTPDYVNVDVDTLSYDEPW
ncbi:MAG: hypothetical protein RhofKO_30230 [Rhodothermales bacterium]